MEPLSYLRAIILPLAIVTVALSSPAQAESVLRVAMTAGDIPDWAGLPDQGSEGYRFVGYSLYEPLVNWDLSRSDVEAALSDGRRRHEGGMMAQPERESLKPPNAPQPPSASQGAPSRSRRSRRSRQTSTTPAVSAASSGARSPGTSAPERRATSATTSLSVDTITREKTPDCSAASTE